MLMLKLMTKTVIGEKGKSKKILGVVVYVCVIFLFLYGIIMQKL